MKTPSLCLLLGLWIANASASEPTTLFDGKTFAGWVGDTNKTWRIDTAALVGGSLKASGPRNEFLCTTRSYTNFVLRLKFKLVGTSGFINAGVQFRSQRATNPTNEMIGYQADLGGPDYWGALYDESRRNRTLAKATVAELAKVSKPLVAPAWVSPFLKPVRLPLKAGLARPTLRLAGAAR